MPRKKNWTASLAETLTDISLIFPPLKNLVVEVFGLLGLIDLLARVWRIL